MMLKIKIKQNTPDRTYTKLCNRMTKQKVFVACGNCDDKWIIGEWEDVVDYLAWYCATINKEAPIVSSLKELTK
jgi:hypothetical protein